MTRKQEIFIKEYILTRNGAESARKAGYNSKSPHKMAYKLLQNSDIRRQVDEAFSRIAEEYKFKEADVYRNIHAIINGENADTTNRLRALELMAKCLGMTKDSNVNVAILNQVDQGRVGLVRKALQDRGLSTKATYNTRYVKSTPKAK